jgi:hypothetical protein
MIHVNVRRLVSQVFEVPCQLPGIKNQNPSFFRSRKPSQPVEKVFDKLIGKEEVLPHHP